MPQFLLQITEIQFIFLLVVLETEIEVHQHSGNLFVSHTFFHL